MKTSTSKSLYYEGISVEQMSEALNREYLTATGWLESVQRKESVDQNGPVPWLTYPALQVLAQITKPHFRVFEYGAGNSTLWWAQRCALVRSVEHDRPWATSVRSQLTDPHDVIARSIDHAIPAEQREFLQTYFNKHPDETFDLDEEVAIRRGLVCSRFKAYAGALLEFPCGYFNIIVIDGMARNLTAWLATQVLSEEGLIVFDNSERPEYQIGYDILGRAGFHRVDFFGLGPINPYGWCTSLFLKNLDLFP